jgi:DNA-binding response OmpR family regulator
MALTLVLSVGFDSQLLATRNLVLQSAGYTVVRAFSLKAAADCFQTLDFDLVLLCQSIPTKEKDRLVSWIRVSGSYSRGLHFRRTLPKGWLRLCDSWQ